MAPGDSIGIRLIYREYGGRHCLRRMRTGSRAQARGARSMKGEAPPKQKSIPVGCSFALATGSLKDIFILH